MPNYKITYWHKTFSHIYVERDAFRYQRTENILSRLSDSKVIPIAHYKDVFNRAGQDFISQKNSPKLILAIRREHFLFEGAALCDHYGHSRFFYTSQMMNCLYNCDYCYLRGLYPSANVVAFVNTEDYFDALIPALPAYLSISYESDLLAFEPLTGFLSDWFGFAQRFANNTDSPLQLEVRTKSAAFDAIAAIAPLDNVILAWTLSPDEIICRYEHGTPPLESRLDSITAALSAGWRVRLCFDPMLLVNGWESYWQKMWTAIQRREALLNRCTISVGGFRMAKAQYKRMCKDDSAAWLNVLPLVEKDGIMCYKPEDWDVVLSLLQNSFIIDKTAQSDGRAVWNRWQA